MTWSDLPLVSVIMAVYNCEDTVGEALDSIAAQTYDQWELVLCDDASTDDTVQVLEEFSAEHPERVTILRNDVNSKLSYSLNRCLEHAHGELIARMDGDDMSQPERFEQQVHYLMSNPGVDLVGTAMQRFDASGLKDLVALNEKPDLNSMRYGVPFAHATIMARRHVYTDLGGYTVSKRTQRGQDWDLWFRFFAQGFVGRNLPEPLYLVREDMAAIKRRSIAVRWQTFRTTLMGFRMLNYPLRWYIRPTLSLAKALVPPRLVLSYRKFQHRRAVESS